MTKVSLRVYDREIEGLIEGGKLDEAIAHCEHVLKSYPMHLETYRLLGKAFLEGRRYADAADIFQRVLMTAPDDFVSHVGMSIIRDDEGKLDDSIWHMERAFEGQPSNPAIQGELRRLYGRRDGVEPPKIRLSRDALANMYAQGELFNQAISEIRAVLLDDPDRPDLQVMLARAYYRSNQKIEAAEMAASLVKKYPYCMDALRILVDVLPGNTTTENAQVYNNRLRQLDPYSAFVTGSVFQTNLVADAAVTMDRLEYTPGLQPAVPQPNWASSLGIKLADEKKSEPTPDWLKNPAGEAASAPLSTEPAASSSPGKDASLPDWMRSSGWQETMDAGTETPGESHQEEAPAEEIAKADIPDWLKAMAPVAFHEDADAKAPESVSPPAGESDIPDWLTGMEAKPEASPAEPIKAEPSSSEEEGEMPDWLSELSPVEEKVEDAVPQGISADEPREEFPAWLMDSVDAHSEIANEPPPATPEESNAAAPVESPNQDSLEPQEMTAESTSPQTAALQDVNYQPVDNAASTLQPVGEIQPDKTTKPLSVDDDTLAWLEGLAAKQGAKEDELLSKPEDRSESLPEWLRPSGDVPSPSASEGESPSLEIVTPIEDIAPQAGEGEAQLKVPEQKPESETDGLEQIPGWLQSSADDAEPLPITEPGLQEGVDSVAGSLPETPVSAVGEEAGQDPLAWLKALDTENQDQPAEGRALAGEFPVSESQPTVTPPSIPEEDMSITSWLSKLDVEEALGKGTIPPDEPAGEVIQPDALPDWLKDMESAAVRDEAPRDPEELPEWLRSSVESSNQEVNELPASPLPPESELPSWIDEETPVSDKSDATVSEEWVPVDGSVEIQPASETLEEAVPMNEEAVADQDWRSEEPHDEVLADESMVPVPASNEVPAESSLEPPAESETFPAEPDLMPAPVVVEKPAEPDLVPEVMEAEVPAEPDLVPAALDEEVLSEPGLPALKEVTPAEEITQPEEPQVEKHPVKPPFKGTGFLAHIPDHDRDSKILMAAQTALDANKLDEAMREYSALIKKKRLLNEVIHDLQEAIYRFPVDIIIWQTLGDANMRANHLQDALDAYTKAEELLR